MVCNEIGPLVIPEAKSCKSISGNLFRKHAFPSQFMHKFYYQKKKKKNLPQLIAYIFMRILGFYVHLGIFI